MKVSFTIWIVILLVTRFNQPFCYQRTTAKIIICSIWWISLKKTKWHVSSQSVEYQNLPRIFVMCIHHFSMIHSVGSFNTILSFMSSASFLHICSSTWAGCKCSTFVAFSAFLGPISIFVDPVHSFWGYLCRETHFGQSSEKHCNNRAATILLHYQRSSLVQGTWNLCICNWPPIWRGILLNSVFWIDARMFPSEIQKDKIEISMIRKYTFLIPCWHHLGI